MINKKSILAVIAITAISTTTSFAQASYDKVYFKEFNKCMDAYRKEDGRAGRFIARKVAGIFGETTYGYDANRRTCDHYADGVANGKYYPVR